MKRILKMMLLVLTLMISTISTISCNKEELFIEPEVVVEDDPTNTDDTDETGNTDNNDSTSPCDFTLDNVQPNTTIVIDCILDLGGKTYNLPANVTIEYDGGDIINGTVNFSEGSIIDGNLLNSTFTMGGSSPQLKDPTFGFDPDRWGIVQGATTSQVAFRNKEILQNIIDKAQDLGINEIRIDKMDAYFEVGNINNLSVFRSREHAINIHSNMTLKMSDDTHLRVFPNRSKNYALMAVFEAENVVIDGGNFYGDRDDHDYSLGGAQEHGHCLQIRSGTNVTVKNARFSDGTGDGLDINSVGRSFESNYNPSKNILVTNNVFDSNRRNNISITDGRDIIIEDNQLLNASINTSKSTGVAPGFGIDVEAVRNRDSNGNLVFDQIAKDIIIRNNIEKDSRVGAITVHIGYYVTVENNTTEMPISYSYTYGTKIIGNTVKAPSGTTSGTAIIAGVPDGDLTVYDNEVSDNIIEDYPIGITVYNRDAKISNNRVTNFVTGIFIKEGTNIEVSKNELTSQKANSKGLFMSLTFLKDVSFVENVVNVTSNPFNFSNVNNGAGQENYKFTLEGNTFSSSNNTTNLISKCKGINLISNTINSSVQVFDAVDLTFNTNNIISSNNHGVYLRNVNQNISLTGNNIDVPAGYECIKQQNTTSSSEVSMTNNSCE